MCKRLWAKSASAIASEFESRDGVRAGQEVILVTDLAGLEHDHRPRMESASPVDLDDSDHGFEAQTCRVDGKDDSIQAAIYVSSNTNALQKVRTVTSSHRLPAFPCLRRSPRAGLSQNRIRIHRSRLAVGMRLT